MEKRNIGREREDERIKAIAKMEIDKYHKSKRNLDESGSLTIDQLEQWFREKMVNLFKDDETGYL